MTEDTKKQDIVSLFNVDSPICVPQEDKLGRKSFAQNIADRINTHRNQEPLVIGIYGPWGYGKTSVLNLVKYYLGKKNENEKGEHFAIIEFNPWVFSQSGDLIERLFFKIRDKLRGKKATDLDKDIADKFESTYLFLNIFREVISAEIIRIISFILFLASLGLLYIPDLLSIGLIGKSIIGGVMLLLLLLTMISTVSKGIANFLRNLAHRRKGTLEKIRKDLERDLKERKDNILIIIDDLDRLMPDEIRLMLQMIKSIINLPRLVFLLAFDEKSVSMTLETQYGKEWGNYLEKIVQVPAHIPAPDKILFNRCILNELQKSVNRFEPEKWEEDRWKQLQLHGLEKVFLKQDNLRKLYRFINRLNLFPSNLAKEINLIDLLGIETIRMFYPDFHKFIYENKSKFTHGIDELKDAIIRDEKKEETARLLDKEFNEYDIEAVSIVEFLFPKIKYIKMTGEFSGPAQDEGLRDLLICSEHHFDKYFIYDLGSSNISQIVLNDFCKGSNTANKCYSIMNKIIDADLFYDFGVRLRASIDEIPKHNSQNVIVSLLNISDEFSITFQMDMEAIDDFLASLIKMLLVRLGESQAREIFYRTILDADTLYLPVLMVARLENSINKGKDTIPPAPAEIIDSLKNVCVSRIEDSFKSKTLIGQKGLRLILECWHDWATRHYIDLLIDEIKNEKGLISFLNNYVSRDNFNKEYLDIGTLAKITDPHKLYAPTLNLENSDLSEEEKKIIRLFEVAYIRWKADEKKK